MAPTTPILFSLLMFMVLNFYHVSAKSEPFSFRHEPPQQMHISLNGQDRMRIAWVTRFEAEPIVYYGTAPRNYTHSAKGTNNMYNFLTYFSGTLHDVVIGPLKPDTTYYYRCSDVNSSSPELSFKTPPSRFPVDFVVVGDLGQTGTTGMTLDMMGKSSYDVALLPGDLSYADMYQPNWDRFGIMVQDQASRRPWMVTHGNHDVEKVGPFIQTPFVAYNARWIMPYEASGSPSNLFYSFDVAGVHVLMLGSYTDFGRESDQFRWLQKDLKKVDRRRTPWLVAVVHAPWYNSNNDHQHEFESWGMMESMEETLFAARVDIVFSGHVHAYERFVRVYKGKANKCGPIYITLGTGGNHEGLASRFMDPQPRISAYREAEHGHGRFSVKSRSLGVWTWHRNGKNIGDASDKVSIQSLASIPACMKAK